MDTIKVHRAGPGRPRTRPDHLLGDKGYSSRKIRAYLRKRGIGHTIPERRDQQANRSRRGRDGGRPPAFDKQPYKKRNVVERCFNRLKKPSHLDGWVGCRSWRGLLSGWCRMSCGSCSSGWCRRRHRGLKAVADVGMVTVKYWPRSSSLPPRVVPGSSCPRHPSGRRGRQPTDASPSGRRPGCGPSSTAWSSTSSAPAVSWTGHAARSTR